MPNSQPVDYKDLTNRKNELGLAQKRGLFLSGTYHFRKKDSVNPTGDSMLGIVIYITSGLDAS